MDLIAAQQWAYLEEVPQDIDEARALLRRYSGLAFDEIDEHILTVRDKVWKTTRYPCIGRWRFLQLTDPKDACYKQVLFRLTIPQTQDAWLDLGCGMAQALRQLRASGVPGHRLFAVDMDSRLLDAGFDLFRDRDSIQAKLVLGNMLDSKDTRLDPLIGQITIVHATSFFHLFSWSEQVAIGKRLVTFLRPGTTNALIYGRQMGTTRPSARPAASSTSYLHNLASLQRLWNEIGSATATVWTVDLHMRPDAIAGVSGFAQHEMPMDFRVFQLPVIQ